MRTQKIIALAVQGIHLVVIEGHLFASEDAQNLNTILRGLTMGSTQPIRLMIDLTKAQLVDSMAVGALILAADQVRKSGEVLRIVGASKSHKELFHITKLDTFIQYIDKRGDALRSFSVTAQV